MAIRDLLWACPLCGVSMPLQEDRGHERCPGCRGTFHRGAGSLIVATTPKGERLERSASEWTRLLPASANLNEQPLLSPERARVRVAEQLRRLHAGGELLGWIERFSKPRSGAISLTADSLRFDADDGQRIDWRLLDMTAVQPSSSSLQIKGRGQPVAAIRFLEGSVRFWEDRIQTAVQTAFRRAGRGEISDFQPRIVTDEPPQRP